MLLLDTFGIQTNGTLSELLFLPAHKCLLNHVDALMRAHFMELVDWSAVSSLSPK